MDAERFARELPRLFTAYPRSKHPRDRRFAPILADVGGLARENNLALLNLAASLLGPGESYVEVGSFKGLSLIAAMLGNTGDFVGIDDFSMAAGSRAQLEANLGRYGLAHDYRSQVRGLRLIEPYLADDALLIVDDTDWPQVARAMRDYVAGQSRAERLLTLDGKDRGQPWWWEGVQILRWRARPVRSRRRPASGAAPRGDRPAPR
jgi:hypothetical protein